MIAGKFGLDCKTDGVEVLTAGDLGESGATVVIAGKLGLDCKTDGVEALLMLRTGDLGEPRPSGPSGPELFCVKESGEGRRGDDLTIDLTEAKGADAEVGEVGEVGMDAVGDGGTDAATLLVDKERFTLCAPVKSLVSLLS